MGNVAEVFRWHGIGPDATVGINMRTYGKDEFVAYSISVSKYSNYPSGAYEQIAAQHEDGETFDLGTGVSRDVWVTNRTIGPQPYIEVGLMRFRQKTGS